LLHRAGQLHKSNSSKTLKKKDLFISREQDDNEIFDISFHNGLKLQRHFLVFKNVRMIVEVLDLSYHLYCFDVFHGIVCAAMIVSSDISGPHNDPTPIVLFH